MGEPKATVGEPIFEGLYYFRVPVQIDLKLFDAYVWIWGVWTPKEMPQEKIGDRRITKIALKAPPPGVLYLRVYQAISPIVSCSSRPRGRQQQASWETAA